MQKITEAHHEYDNPGIDTKYLPCKSGDTYRLYHGFRDKHHAIEAASRGLSGKIKADRVYSFEYDNNPNGLYCSLSFKVASEFGRILMEFKADSGQLEAPVWPGGSYTVQGGYSQYFGHGRQGKMNRLQRQKDAEKEVEIEINDRTDLDHIKLSDKKYLSYLLTNSREHQALYIGDLSPEDIIAFHVADTNSYNTAYTRYSVEEFLEKFSEDVANLEKKKSRKMFKPNDIFDPHLFLQRMADEFNRGNVTELNKTIAGFWPDIVKSTDRKSEFLYYFENYLWPKQYALAFNWMKKQYGTLKEGKENNTIQNGLYVAASFIPESVDDMIDFVEHFEIPNFVDEFHTTIVHSTKSINWNDADDVYKKVKPLKWEVWDMRNGKKCLVLQVESKYLHKRWQLAMDRGALYDFPEYKPHISFSYGIEEDFDVDSLPLPTFDIVIKSEYSEPLDSNK